MFALYFLRINRCHYIDCAIELPNCIKKSRIQDKSPRLLIYQYIFRSTTFPQEAQVPLLSNLRHQNLKQLPSTRHPQPPAVGMNPLQPATSSALYFLASTGSNSTSSKSTHRPVAHLLSPLPQPLQCQPVRSST